MLERVRHNVRALVLGGALVAGALASVAFAAPAPATDIKIDDNGTGVYLGDAWINAAEWNAVTVEGKYTPSGTPANDRVRVILVNSSACDLETAEISVAKNATLDSGAGTFAVDFDLETERQSETTPGFPLPNGRFSEGAVMCALVRVSNDGGLTYGERTVSSNKPVLDTVVLPGTAQLLDTDSNEFVNAVEATPPTGTDSLVEAVWTQDGPDTSDYDKAAIGIFDTAPAVDTFVAACFDQTSYTRTPTGNVFLTKSCTAALTESDFPASLRHDQFARDRFFLTVNWLDKAGNTTATPATSNGLIKDTTAPDVLITHADKITSAPNTFVEAPDPVELINYQGNHRGYLVDGQAEIDSTVEMTIISGTGTLSATQIAVDEVDPDPLDPPASDDKLASVTYRKDVRTLPDDPAAKVILEATDLAGNTASTQKTVGKDTIAPDRPAVLVDPDEITGVNQSFVEVSVGGDAGSMARVVVNDENLLTPPLEVRFELGSILTKIIDVSPLDNGRLTFDVTLNDEALADSSAPLGPRVSDCQLTSVDFRFCGNVGLTGTATAIKDTTIPLSIVSPAGGSLTQGTLFVSGAALLNFPNGTPTGITSVEVTEGTVTLGSAPVNQVSGAWSLRVIYSRSGSHAIRARALTADGPDPDSLPDQVGNATPIRIFDADAGKPTATTLTPAVAIYLPGEAVKIEGTAQDDFSGLLAVELNFFDVRGRQVGLPVNATCDGGCTGRKKVEWKFDASHLAPGYYAYKIFAIDLANNRQVNPATGTFLKPA